MWRKVRIMSTGVAVVAVLAGGGLAPAAASTGVNGPRPGGHAMFTTHSWGGLAGRVAATTIPTWNGSFTINSTTYSYQMVGTNPAGGSKTTTVPTEILPLKVVMSNGITVTGSASKLKASPIFSNAAFTSGSTQLGDAMLRSGFWKTVQASSPKWHLLLGTPKVLPTVTVKVPAADGTGFTSSSGAPFVNILYSWWANKLQSIITAHKFAHKFAANTLPLMISGTTFLYIGNTSDCCVYGYHGAYSSASGENTYVFGNWIAAGVVANGNADVYTMSHEVSEWAADPYVSNVVPTWNQPDGATCFNSLLEVGDPVEAMPKPWYTIKVGTVTYHPSDIAGISWFSHGSPSLQQSGLYSYKGYLKTPNTTC
jgi:hypothetical protein